jgi:hypothetical protein
VLTRRAGQEETLMRRQYHSQLVGGHTLIWDVQRLVELTRGYPIQQIPLLRIHELDECFWFGDEPATCRAVTAHAKLIEETDLAYPIILSASGRVMDGMHRVCKALLKNMATVRAVQFTQDPEPDYVGPRCKGTTLRRTITCLVCWACRLRLRSRCRATVPDSRRSAQAGCAAMVYRCGIRSIHPQVIEIG